MKTAQIVATFEPYVNRHNARSLQRLPVYDAIEFAKTLAYQSGIGAGNWRYAYNALRDFAV